MPSLPSTITLLALDVDGVLTDGSVFLTDAGSEIKRFNIRDGTGLRVWQRLGFRAAVVTGRAGRALQHRCAELGIADVIQGSHDKASALDALIARTGIDAAHIAFLADDWPDLPILRRVGYPMAVADADPRVKALAAFITTRPGGRGAVREAIEHLLTARGMLDRAAALFD